MIRRLAACVAPVLPLIAVLSAAPSQAIAEDTVVAAIAEFGDPKYPAGFDHFDYADPAAPKGGNLTISAVGTFDTLNDVPLEGEPPRSLGLLYDSLMIESQDEVGVLYGLVAESLRYPEDESWVEFTLRPEARFHDGVALTADDVAWSYETIRDHGNPFQQSFYSDVKSVTVIDPQHVRFDFTTTGTRKPITQIATLTVYPKHWWTAEGRDITKGTLEPPLGSGPYRITAVDQGRSLSWERVTDYWAADLPVNRGLWNFDRIRYDYYRDRDAEFEAFKSGASDFRQEYTSLYWATGYDVPAVADGRLIKQAFPAEDPRGMQGFFFNQRRPLFQDARVREALTWLYDFEWVDKTLLFGLYDRLHSYFNGAGYGQSGGVAEGLEREILERFRGQVPDAVIDEPFVLPTTDGTGQMRTNVRTALRLLQEAGWEQRNGVMTNVTTGEPFVFEILFPSSASALERLTQPWVDRLRQVGITATIRFVDPAQFQLRTDDFDFDAASFAYTFYPPPGQELRSYFGSAAADVKGSANLMAIKSPVVDALIEAVIAAQDLETKKAATAALDRVLLWGWYCMPQWGRSDTWIAYWNRFGMPAVQPTRNLGYGNGIAFQPTWWVDPALDAKLGRGT
jgi:microcin C transport system substrate-binding protein